MTCRVSSHTGSPACLFAGDVRNGYSAYTRIREWARLRSEAIMENRQDDT